MLISNKVQKGMTIDFWRVLHSAYQALQLANHLLIVYLYNLFMDTHILWNQEDYREKMDGQNESIVLFLRMMSGRREPSRRWAFSAPLTFPHRVLTLGSWWTWKVSQMLSHYYRVSLQTGSLVHPRNWSMAPGRLFSSLSIEGLAHEKLSTTQSGTFRKYF